MNNNLSIQELIKLKKLPTAKAIPLKSNRELYSIDDTEDAVCAPHFAPTDNAYIYELKKGKQEWFRKSESEPTYTKKVLKKEFGLKSNDFQNVIVFDTAYSEKTKGHEDLYRLSSFKNYKKIDPNFPEWYENLVELLTYAQKREFTKLHTSTDFSITVGMKFLKVEFERFSIIYKVPLKELCQQKITSTTSRPREDFRLQVVVPLAEMIVRLKDRFLNQLDQVIHFPNKEIEINSLEKHEIKKAFTEFVNSVRIEKDKQLTYKALMSNKPYHELFPCREITREITVYIAPTNSGKTYQSCEAIKQMIDVTEFETAQCFFPLRALAAQLKDDFVKEGYPCDLITGEEREFEPEARISCCTTEIIDPGHFKNLMFIDECQMIFDHNKQAAYTRAILGAYCNELKLAVAPYYADALIEILKKYTNDTINIIKLERLCPLSSCGDMHLDDVEKGDIVVAYRTKSIHIIAEGLRNKGLKVGVIYGRMSPSARRSMIKGFMENGCDCLVATDAIGMGLSIPAKRVLIAEGTKYDGISVRQLEDEEMRQVAGRAGRFGFYDEGFYGTLDVSSLMEEDRYSPADLSRINDAMIIKDDFKASMELSVLPDKNILRSVEDLSLEATLDVWKDSVTSHENITVSKDNFEYILSKASFLDGTAIKDREILVSLLFVVYPEDRDNVWKKVYQEMVNKAIFGKKITIEDYYMLNTGYKNQIVDYEDLSLYLTLLSQFQRIYPDLCPDEDCIMRKQNETGELLSTLLLKLYATT